MEKNFVPECYFDTLLVKTILNIKTINHQKCCTKVAITVKRIDDFAVGIIDKDKKQIDYLQEFNQEIVQENQVLWKHKTKNHYFIQLAPAAEEWILNAAKETGLDLNKIGLPNDLRGIMQFTKHESANENILLINLCNELKKANGKTMGTLTLWLNYLFENNRNADINIMKKWI